MSRGARSVNSGVLSVFGGHTSMFLGLSVTCSLGFPQHVFGSFCNRLLGLVFRERPQILDVVATVFRGCMRSAFSRRFGSLVGTRRRHQGFGEGSRSRS